MKIQIDFGFLSNVRFASQQKVVLQGLKGARSLKDKKPDMMISHCDIAHRDNLILSLVSSLRLLTLPPSLSV